MVVGVETIARKTPLKINCNQNSFEFPSLERRKIEASFNGVHVSSDGGALFLRQADRLLGLTKSFSKVMIDPRQSGRITHSTLDLLRQRINGLALVVGASRKDLLLVRRRVRIPPQSPLNSLQDRGPEVASPTPE